ncbi:TPA: phage tail protein [Citrobacter sedlakii]|uniref:phage tail fiber protein n=1 Tax=uncultured Citrobacter sp. TaxID=200446 RepID=UPI00259425DC|nr:phage tail protein [uncultured Citrobacter sp.]
MSAGTLTLTNNSDIVTGIGTSFATELAAGDFVVVTVGGVPYTLPVKSVESDTGLTLVSVYTGPTQSGAAWSAVPRVALNMVTAALVAQSAEALRGLNYDKQNWQQLFSNNGNITVTLTDGSQFSGPSWPYMISTVATKTNGAVPVNQGGTGSTTAQGARINLGLVDDAGVIPVSLGGTGSNTASGARSNLGLGNSATRNVNSSSAIPTPGTPEIAEQNAKDFRGIISYAVPSAFPLGVSSGIMTGNQGFGQASTNFVGVISSRNWNDSSGEQSCFQIAVNQWGAGYKRATPDGQGNWYLSDLIKWLTSGNTTVDANGFIKVASPIVKIFRDGSYETNEESEGVAVTHINTGEYLIAGCTGLNADAAWGGIDGGFEIPVDRNKLARIWLDYEVNADGSVLVKTYHRTHPEAPEFARNEINGLTNGEPVDIPADSFVSVRVEMPPDSIWNQRQNDALEADVQKPTS